MQDLRPNDPRQLWNDFISYYHVCQSYGFDRLTSLKKSFGFIRVLIRVNKQADRRDK